MAVHTLIIPGLFEPPQVPPSADFPHLDFLLSKAEITTQPEQSHEFLIAHHAGWQVDQNDVPSGAMIARAAGLETGDYVWARAHPAYFHIDRDRLILLNGDSRRNDAAAENTQLCKQFNSHFADQGVQLFVIEDMLSSRTQWLIRISENMQLTTTPFDRVFGRSIDPFMPQGEDAGWLRSLLNETQMLLQAIEHSGSYNGFWFWGFGKYPLSGQASLHITGNSPLLQGLMKNQHKVTDTGDALHVDESCLHAFYQEDVQQWMLAVKSFDQLIGKLLDTMRRNKNDELVVEAGSGHRIRYNARMRYRFWRKRHFQSFLGQEESGISL